MTYELQDKFPVYVTYTTKHLVWVEAANQADAVAYMETEPYEYTNSSNVVEGWWNTAAPDKYDEPHERADAHVQTWKSHLWRVKDDHGAAMAEEENRRGIKPADRLTCRYCRAWLDADHEREYSHQFAIRQDELRAAEMAESLGLVAA